MLFPAQMMCVQRCSRALIFWSPVDIPEMICTSSFFALQQILWKHMIHNVEKWIYFFVQTDFASRSSHEVMVGNLYGPKYSLLYIPAQEPILVPTIELYIAPRGVVSNLSSWWRVVHHLCLLFLESLTDSLAPSHELLDASLNAPCLALHKGFGGKVIDT